MNKTIKKLLENAQGMRSGTPLDHRQDFMDLFGCWTETDAAEFADSTESFRKVDPGDWG